MFDKGIAGGDMADSERIKQVRCSYASANTSAMVGSEMQFHGRLDVVQRGAASRHLSVTPALCLRSSVPSSSTVGRGHDPCLATKRVNYHARSML